MKRFDSNKLFSQNALLVFDRVMNTSLDNIYSYCICIAFIPSVSYGRLRVKLFHDGGRYHIETSRINGLVSI